MESGFGDGNDFCCFTLAGENLVGKGNATFDVNRIINFYVADASY
ncbi:hypothetical protein KD5_30590 [Yersinia pseudotuberculosis]|uniref:Uncharacterized protein n=1 Tax=Yersinia pseudotuberculosis serotype O:3 (strain YPIII) TaxID=502800 RepID=A0A0H3B6W2_YERPY|nr:hypothetical protein YPSE1_28940 [Yersinia pseudotuberculosis]GAE11644.1 hypothetical protein YP1_046_00330 [Yersinia pseudotuberculosis NBRC 105692]